MTKPATALARIHRRNQIHAAHGGTTFCGIEVTDGIPLTNGSYPSCKKCRKGWKADGDAQSLQRVSMGTRALIVAPPPSLDTLCKLAQSEIDAMSWNELDVQTIEQAINLGGKIGRANPVQQAHGVKKGDIQMNFIVRDVSWKPKFKRGDNVEVDWGGKVLKGKVLGDGPNSERGMYGVGFEDGSQKPFYEKEMRAI